MAVSPASLIHPSRIPNRWVQLIAGIVAMMAIANLQYAWILFTKPLTSSLHTTETPYLEGAVTAQASHGGVGELRPKSVDRTERLLCGRGVPIDNNVSEREMKRVVLNRKNSLFVGNPRGGRTAAIVASLTSTCRRHGLDPQLYLTQLLVNLPQIRRSELPSWLPDQWKLAQATRLASLQNTASPPS